MLIFFISVSVRSFFCRCCFDRSPRNHLSTCSLGRCCVLAGESVFSIIITMRTAAFLALGISRVLIPPFLISLPLFIIFNLASLPSFLLQLISSSTMILSISPLPLFSLIFLEILGSNWCWVACCLTAQNYTWMPCDQTGSNFWKPVCRADTISIFSGWR